MKKLAQHMLLNLEKPAQYAGNEIGSVHKKITDYSTHFVLCFPDLYEIGMSHLGLSILYNLLNARSDTYCERLFSPMKDMEKMLLDLAVPLFSLESKTPIRDFDFLGFTLQYEMAYTNVLNVLKLSNLELRSQNRQAQDPIVCAGGPCAYNPEPLAPFIDFFYIGDGESGLDEVLDIYRQLKQDPTIAATDLKQSFLEAICNLRGIYVPAFYAVDYHPDGTIKGRTALYAQAPIIIEKQIAIEMDDIVYASEPIVPFLQPVHDRVVLELFRGCSRGCRFCQAGFIYRPVREKSLATLEKQAQHLVNLTGHDEVSLISLSSSDYSKLSPLCDYLIDDISHKHKTNLSLPSLRIDSFSLDLMNKVQDVRKSSLTFAPEAGSQRMRNVINKGITEQDILNGSQEAFLGGWNRVKLYFMLGLPGETTEDVLAIPKLGDDIIRTFYRIPKPQRPPKALSIVISTSFFVPKPFTPFQWVGQDTEQQFLEKQDLVNRQVDKKRIRYNCHDAKTSMIEGVLARGDRRVAEVIEHVFRQGASFCSWSEHFDFSKYQTAFTELGIDPAFYANRERDYEEMLPWDFIDIGVSKQFLIDEAERSKEEQLTVNCMQGCAGCGAAKYKGGICFEDKT